MIFVSVVICGDGDMALFGGHHWHVITVDKQRMYHLFVFINVVEPPNSVKCCDEHASQILIDMKMSIVWEFISCH